MIKTFLRKALNKAEAAKLKERDRMEQDKRKLKLANHVIKEMKKIADSGQNKSHSKGNFKSAGHKKWPVLSQNDRSLSDPKRPLSSPSARMKIDRYFRRTEADKSSAIFQRLLY